MYLWPRFVEQRLIWNEKQATNPLPPDAGLPSVSAVR